MSGHRMALEPEPVVTDEGWPDLAAREAEVARWGADDPPATVDDWTVEGLATVWANGLGQLLLDSGITTEVARARGYETVCREGDARGYGFSKAQAGCITRNHHGLLVPLWDVASSSCSPTGHQMRPSRPRRNDKGDEIKYETCPKQGNLLDVNPLMKAKVLDASVELWITEGARKVDALASVGLACIGLSGVSNWVGKETPGDPASPSRPLPQWDVVPLKGRRVVVCFDSDVATKPAVAGARRKLSMFLAERGADVYWAALPDAANGDKQGIDDFLGGGNTIADLTVEPADLPDTGGKPGFNVTVPATVFDELAAGLGRGVLTGFFRRNGEIVHVPAIGQDGYELPPEGEDGPAQVRPVTVTFLRAAIQQRFFVYRDAKDMIKPAICPSDPVSLALEAAPHWQGTPSIETVTHTPIVLPDGTILTAPGFDAASRTLFLPSPDLEITTVPDRPDDSAVSWATSLLSDLLHDFPFESDESKATMLALLLTPLTRRVLPPPYPLFVINAHQPGSGKTLLSQVARALHGGVHRPELPQSDEELRKQVSGILSTTTAPIVVWDNASATIKSPVLAGLLTERTWNDRLLGTNREIAAINDRIWVTTGNNVTPGGDMARRCYWVSLDPQHEHPEQRDGFLHHPLIDYVERYRGLLLCALLVLVRRWVCAGRQVVNVRSDSYGQWAGAMAEILRPFDLTDAFATQDHVPAAISEDDEELGAFLLALTASFGESAFQVKDVTDKVAASFENPNNLALKDALPASLRRKHETFGDIAKSLGWYFSKNKQRYAIGRRIVEVGDGRGGKVWKVEFA
ncbi:MAG TPA: DUF3854 domain-containing protein [Mycobacteriales bacterium]|nr:DUF3854 domain-containing protein [Mycobacteriales bacterium]